MKSESGIKNRWQLLACALGKDIKREFSAYGWYSDGDIRVSKSEHWRGWWNDCFEFVTIFPLSEQGKRTIKRVSNLFAEQGYTISPAISGGISISYETMTAQESHEKARENLLNGGRMSD